ncbi:hypothetical protein AgCh_025296 [Apium graveolens]
MRRGLDWGWGGDEEEGVFEEENWASVLDTDADERLLRNKEERGIGKMGKRKKVAHTKAKAANDHLTKELEERKELVKTLFIKHQSEEQGTKKTYKRKFHLYKKGNIRMVESRRK